jgi:hypothetical protein
MNIDLGKLGFEFSHKPLLVGGMAMEYYGLRQSGADIDLVVTAEDYSRLAHMYPDNLKEIEGDLGVCVFEFEIWKTISYFDYEFLSDGAIKEDSCLVISLEKLLFMKALCMKEEKYRKDLELIVERVLQQQSEIFHAK